MAERWTPGSPAVPPGGSKPGWGDPHPFSSDVLFGRISPEEAEKKSIEELKSGLS